MSTLATCSTLSTVHLLHPAQYPLLKHPQLNRLIILEGHLISVRIFPASIQCQPPDVQNKLIFHFLPISFDTNTRNEAQRFLNAPASWVLCLNRPCIASIAIGCPKAFLEHRLKWGGVAFVRRTGDWALGVAVGTGVVDFWLLRLLVSFVPLEGDYYWTFLRSKKVLTASFKIHSGNGKIKKGRWHFQCCHKLSKSPWTFEWKCGWSLLYWNTVSVFNYRRYCSSTYKETVLEVIEERCWASYSI